MTIRRSILVLILTSAIVAGCGGGGEKKPPPTAPAPSDIEPNDFTPQSVGTLSATDIVQPGTTSAARDVDLFRVTLPSSANLFVSLDWSSASHLELTISNAAGIFVREVNTAGHPQSCRLPGLPAGDYTVRVGSFTDVATNYTLTLGQR